MLITEPMRPKAKLEKERRFIMDCWGKYLLQPIEEIAPLPRNGKFSVFLQGFGFKSPALQPLDLMKNLSTCGEMQGFV